MPWHNSVTAVGRRTSLPSSFVIHEHHHPDANNPGKAGERVVGHPDGNGMLMYAENWQGCLSVETLGRRWHRGSTLNELFGSAVVTPKILSPSDSASWRNVRLSGTHLRSSMSALHEGTSKETANDTLDSGIRWKKGTSTAGGTSDSDDGGTKSPRSTKIDISALRSKIGALRAAQSAQ